MNISSFSSSLSSSYLSHSSHSSPRSILFSNRMTKYREEKGLSIIPLDLEDNIEWEMPAFIIENDSNSILGHKRLFSSIEKTLQNEKQEHVVYTTNPSLNVPLMKRQFSVMYDPCTIIKNSIPVTYNRLSYAKIADYCSLNYPKSVKLAYKKLLYLWTKHIQEYPDYWKHFDIKCIKRIYKNELGNTEYNIITSENNNEMICNDLDIEYKYNQYRYYKNLNTNHTISHKISHKKEIPF